MKKSDTPAAINAADPPHKKEKVIMQNSTHKAVDNGDFIRVIIKGFEIDGKIFPDEFLFAIIKEDQDDLQAIFAEFDEDNLVNRSEVSNDHTTISQVKEAAFNQAKKNCTECGGTGSIDWNGSTYGCSHGLSLEQRSFNGKIY